MTVSELRDYLKRQVAAYKYLAPGVDRRRAAEGGHRKDPQAEIVPPVGPHRMSNR
jgi:hypothetical protein